jgi:chemotaxis protein histidine kinase CheA
MSIPEINPLQGIEAIADAQLQQELQSLFFVDTQNYLQRYSQIAQHLQAGSWKADIQELYRCIHTIKGGAVTVGAEAVLHVATALEDVLDDLRYLDLAPPLADGCLSQALLEAGELLTGTLELQNSQEDTKPLLDRIQSLHQTIQEQYLPQWDEIKQLHQDFAEQGLDLVVLELEIALERSPHQGTVSPAMLNIAQQTLTQLQQIGKELQFAAGWADLLHQAEALLAQPENAVWRSQWRQFFQALKACAKQGGNAVEIEIAQLESIDLERVDDPAHSNPALTIELDSLAIDTSSQSEYDSSDDLINDLINDLTDDLFGDASTNLAIDQATAWLDELAPTEADPSLDISLDTTRIGNNNPQQSLDDLPDLSQVQAWLDQPIQTNELFESLQAGQSPQLAAESSLLSQPPAKLNISADPQNAQIPVSLEKLDRSAQYLTDTLLSLRTTQGAYQTLQNQISQIVALAQEGIEYITHLRQIQDDYALLSHLSTQVGPTPERYRQGYSIINRLLESSLRLSEIGAEAGKTAQQLTENMRTVDTSVLQLQNTVEDSRLVPFYSLGFRAKAILRDLTTRYGKSAQLVIQGEQTELDVSIARNLEPALLHLIRNAYDHGLESPAERVAQGKPEQGTIVLSLQRQGNTFRLELGDDGRGLDPQAIQTKAETLGLPLTSTQTPAELLAVICQPGFTSATQASEVSGRGVGMDVVAAQVTRLGGRLSLQTVSGTGTTFRLQFPVPRLLVSCVVLQAGYQTFAIPEDHIKTIALLNTLNASRTSDANSAYSCWTIQDDAGSTPALDLWEYWQRRSIDRSLPDTAVCVYIDMQPSDTQAQQGIWLLADELLELAELIINPLPTPLVAPDGLIGLSLQPNGSLIPVLEAHAVADWLHTGSIAPVESIPIQPLEPEWQLDRLTPTILIVDDAALMRRRLEASLSAYGHITHMCANGQEAWNWLQDHRPPSLVITDIEMPVMDGFTLIDRCRQAGITVPILVISSRLLEEWFDEAKRLGATDYLTKGFSTAELMTKVNSLLSLIVP